MKHLDILNKYYTDMHNDKQTIIDYLEENEFPFLVGYYPFHSFRKNDEFYLEQYPIPVITVGGKVDIGIDVEHMFFEFRFVRDFALNFDYTVFEEYQFEVYGTEDYYDDYYFGDIEEIKNNIELSDELEIGVSILITKENILEETKGILELLETII